MEMIGLQDIKDGESLIFVVPKCGTKVFFSDFNDLHSEVAHRYGLGWPAVRGAVYYDGLVSAVQ